MPRVQARLIGREHLQVGRIDQARRAQLASHLIEPPRIELARNATQPEWVRVDLRLFEGDGLNDPDEVVEQVYVGEDEEVVVTHDVSSPRCTVAPRELVHILLIELWQTAGVASAVLIAAFEGGMAPRPPGTLWSDPRA